MINIMIQEISKTQIESYSTINDRFSYDTSKMLGKGASASVYLGYDKQQGQQIAVKHVPLQQYNKSRSAFERELLAMRRLNHPNIIGYYGEELDKYDGLYIFLELCQQKSLEICIMEQLREEETLRLFSQLVEGMAYMNNHNIIHRDLKPSNLLLSLSGDLKIADFGQCRELEEALSVNYTLQRVGTPYYSSPEYQQGQPYNEISDVYSAGYILYEMLTREKIMDRDIKHWKSKYQGQDYDGDQMIHLIREIVKEKINSGGWKLDHPTLSAKRYWLPILYRMLELDPSRRASFQEVKLMLKDVHPTGALPVVRTITESEQQRSSELRRKVELWLRFCEYQNSRWLWIFDMLKKPQLFSLENIPRLYQILFLYFSLLCYCKDLSQLSHNLANRDTDLFIGEDLFGPIFEALTVTGRLKVTAIMDQMLIGLNTLRENARRVLEKVVLPDLVRVAQLQGLKPEMMVLEELQLSIQTMVNRQKREEESILFLAGKFYQLLGYLYKTDSQLQSMAANDIRSYLILLLVGNCTRSESKSEEVEQFRRFSNEQHLSFKWIGSLKRQELLEMSMQTKRGKAKSWKKKEP